MRRVSTISGVFFALALATAPAQAMEYLSNGGFETGDFAGWTQGGNFQFTNVVSGLSPNGEYSGPQNGTYYTYAGPGDSPATLSQTFVDTPGEKLTISGWVIGNNLGPSYVNFLFNNALFLSIGDPVPDQPWTQYSFSTTATGNDTFSLAFRDDPAFIGLDSLSVSNSAAVATTPLPSSLTMMILGLAVFLFIMLLGRRPAGFRGRSSLTSSSAESTSLA
jgi:hypothetical protein